MKRMGARNAGNPHVACDVEGAGDVAGPRRLGLARIIHHRSGKGDLLSIVQF
jgi:hypothetical protein